MTNRRSNDYDNPNLIDNKKDILDDYYDTDIDDAREADDLEEHNRNEALDYRDED